MEIKKGIGVSPGVSIARAVILDAEEYRIAQKTVSVDDIPAELERLRNGFDASLGELHSLQEVMARQLGPDIAAIFDFHYGVLSQDRLFEQIASLITQKNYSAAYAVREVLRGYQRRFLNMKDQLFRERVRDVHDIEHRLLRHLCGQSGEELTHLTEPFILVAHDLTPSQVANLGQTQVTGVAMDAGGLTCHTAIVVRSMGIPAVMGLKDVSTRVPKSDTIILDGTKGLVIVRPDTDMLQEYRVEEERIHALANDLVELRDKPAVTTDNVKIPLLANIEFPYEAKGCIEKGRRGHRPLPHRVPLPPQRRRAHRGGALRGLPPVHRRRAATARSPSAPSTSGPTSTPRPRPANRSATPSSASARSATACRTSTCSRPSCGRSSGPRSTGDVRIMFPLITSLMELRQAKMVLGDAMEDLEEDGDPLPAGHAHRYNGRDPRGGPADQGAAPRSGLFQHRDERPDPVHPGGRPRQRAGRPRSTPPRTRRCSGSCGTSSGPPSGRTFSAASAARWPASRCTRCCCWASGFEQFSMAPSDCRRSRSSSGLPRSPTAARVAKRALWFDTDRQVSNYLRDETRKTWSEFV